MASIVIDGPLDGQVRSDGSPWPMALATGQATILGENAADLIAHLIPGYGDLADDDEGNDTALIMRWQTCVATASDVQALICADRVQEGRFDPTVETEDALSVLFSDKTVPVEDFGSWDNPDVPLVLIATDYAPFAERPPVTGNVVWLDPSDEVAFLRSLAALGVVEFYVHEEA